MRDLILAYKELASQVLNRILKKDKFSKRIQEQNIELENLINDLVDIGEERIKEGQFIEIIFSLDENGKITQCILKTMGIEIQGVRIDK